MSKSQKCVLGSCVGGLREARVKKEEDVEQNWRGEGEGKQLTGGENWNFEDCKNRKERKAKSPGSTQAV